MKQQISRVVQSPMNARRWSIELACGHEVWVTSRTRPRKESIFTDKATGEKMIGPRKIACPQCLRPTEAT